MRIHLSSRPATCMLLLLVTQLAQGCLIWRYPITPDISGYVMDAATTKPIADATVSIQRKAADGRKPVDVVRTTSTYGAFRLPALHVWRPCLFIPGDYWPSGTLLVQAPGYRAYEQPVQTFGGGKLVLPQPIDLVPEDSPPSSIPPRPEPPKLTLPRTAPPDRALLYVIRPSTVPVLHKSEILVNGLTVARLGGKEYLALELPPGAYTIHEHWSWISGIPDNQLRLQVDKAQAYYLMLDTTIEPSAAAEYVRVRSKLELLRSDDAAAKLAHCSPAKQTLDVTGLIRPQ